MHFTFFIMFYIVFFNCGLYSGSMLAECVLRVACMVEYSAIFFPVPCKTGNVNVFFLFCA